MTEPLSFEEIVQLHKETFGVDPVITGAGHWDNEPISTRIIKAIEAGEPYVEEDVDESVDV